MKKHKILYIMNVDWNWIKQRPHYIAEGLSEKYPTKIAYRYRYDRSKLQDRAIRTKDLIPIFLIPKISNFNCLKWLNTAIFKFVVMGIVSKYKIDTLYLTFPDQVELIPLTYQGKIIYDCMDNHAAFIQDSRKQHILKEEEAKLIEQSDIVLVSSKYLLENIINKFNNVDNKVKLVRNAYNGEIIQLQKIQSPSRIFKMAYIGTLSSWFDWKTVMKVVDRKEDVELHLFGPLAKTQLPNSSRIVYHGTVDHSELYDLIKGMDVLIMPFIINDIIKAVDPVKVYEYINFNKNIIMCRYDEVERLKNFVYFYSSEDEFLDAIQTIEKSRKVKYSNEERIKFLQNNKWSNRVNQIVELIECMDLPADLG